MMFIEVYWSDITTIKTQGIKGTNYDNYDKSRFVHTTTLFNLSCKYTKFSLGFNWIFRFKMQI